MNLTYQQSGAVTTITTTDSQLTLFVTSDVHFDSPYCARRAFFADLDEAARRGAAIFIIGDLFDAMQGRFDPRRDLAHLRPEYRRGDYYDAIVADATRLLAPYAASIALISPGNHEMAVLKNANTYLSDRLVAALNAQHGGRIVHGGYGGWLRIMHRPDGRWRGTVLVRYFHGSGGDAPVTKGVIQTNRQAVYLPDAHVVINGHSHNAYWVPLARERVSGKGQHYFDVQHHLRTPGYHQSYGDGSQGWEVTRGGVPKPLGGAWITTTASHGKELSITVTPHLHNPVPLSPTVDLHQGIVFPQE